MRNIAGTGFNSSEAKRLCSAAGWELATDEPAFGFLKFYLWLRPGVANRRLLNVATPEADFGPHLSLPLYYFPEDEEDDPELTDRTPYYEAYEQLRDGLDAILGEPDRDGTYELSGRPDWAFGFRTWRVPEAQVILLQDEHDLQFGMDVSLWMFPAGLDVTIPLPF